MKAYQRSVDDGFGIQTVIVNSSDKIVAQWLSAKSGLRHSYTGDGNPELIGASKSALRGKRFVMLRGKSAENAIEYYLED